MEFVVELPGKVPIIEYATRVGVGRTVEYFTR